MPFNTPSLQLEVHGLVVLITSLLFLPHCPRDYIVNHIQRMVFPELGLVHYKVVVVGSCIVVLYLLFCSSLAVSVYILFQVELHVGQKQAVNTLMNAVRQTNEQHEVRKAIEEVRHMDGRTVGSIEFGVGDGLSNPTSQKSK